MSKVSTLFYTSESGSSDYLEIPTIQSLSIPDDTTIPSKSTITGDYRNQFVTKSPVKVAFVAWLEGEQYLDTIMDVSGVLDKLVMLRDSKIRFDLITTHSGEESRFLTGLAIENITLDREASSRNRLVCTVNCIQIKLVDLSWQQASAVQIFGHDIFTNQPTQAMKKDFKLSCANKDFSLNDDNAGPLNSAFNGLNSAYNNLAYESGLKQAPTSWIVKKALGNSVPLDTGTYYYKLTDPIDMSEGNRTYVCNASFPSRYGGLSQTDQPYTVNLGQFTIKTDKHDASLVPNFSKAYAMGGGVPIESKYGTTPYVYDFADTYPGYTVSKNFESTEPVSSLTKYLKSAPTSSDPATIGNGNVIVKDGYVQTYKIKDRYKYSITYNNSTKTFVPDGGIRVDKYNLNTSSNGFKASLSNDAFQSDFDSAYKNSSTGAVNYPVTVVAVTKGTMLQVYLFSKTLFQRSSDVNCDDSGSTDGT